MPPFPFQIQKKKETSLCHCPLVELLKPFSRLSLSSPYVKTWPFNFHLKQRVPLPVGWSPKNNICLWLSMSARRFPVQEWVLGFPSRTISRTATGSLSKTAAGDRMATSWSRAPTLISASAPPSSTNSHQQRSCSPMARSCRSRSRRRDSRVHPKPVMCQCLSHPVLGIPAM